MNKKSTIGILQKFLWFCGIGSKPAPLLGIARHTPFVAICGARALENAQSRSVTGFERATIAPHTFCGDLWRPRPGICGVREVIRAAIRAAMKKKVKKFLRAARI